MWNWIARIFAFVVGALMLCLSLPVLFRPAPEGLPWGAHLPGISLELALDPAEAVRFINLQRESGRDVLADLDDDDHVVIPVYVALLVVLGVWLLGRSVPSARILGVLVIAAALLAGYSDRQENQGIRSIVAQYQDPGGGQIQQDTVDHMRGWSILKWGLLATTMALLSVPFFAGRRSLPIGVLYLLCALTYAVGLIGHRAGLAGFVEWGFYLMGLAWLLTFVGIGAVPGAVSKPG